MERDNSLRVIYPQEIEAWYVLPVIRNELAVAMKNEGLSQKEIAKTLGITEAAVSQYINKKRGNDFEIKVSLKHAFVDSAKLIIKDNSLIFSEVQRLLKILWDNDVVCELHKSKSWCPDGCGACF